MHDPTPSFRLSERVAISVMALSGHLDASSRMSAFGGDLNGSTQHSILKGKDGVFGNASRLFSRLYGIRENRALGSLAAGRVAESGLGERLVSHHRQFIFSWPHTGEFVPR